MSFIFDKTRSPTRGDRENNRFRKSSPRKSFDFGMDDSLAARKTKAQADLNHYTGVIQTALLNHDVDLMRQVLSSGALESIGLHSRRSLIGYSLCRFFEDVNTTILTTLQTTFIHQMLDMCDLPLNPQWYSGSRVGEEFRKIASGTYDVNNREERLIFFYGLLLSIARQPQTNKTLKEERNNMVFGLLYGEGRGTPIVQQAQPINEQKVKELLYMLEKTDLLSAILSQSNKAQMEELKTYNVFDYVSYFDLKPIVSLQITKFIYMNKNTKFNEIQADFMYLLLRKSHILVGSKERKSFFDNLLRKAPAQFEDWYMRQIRSIADGENFAGLNAGWWNFFTNNGNA